ncbi:MAG: TetR/AcrR family transcriptional regulator [Eubacteriales bacterium]|nr:TetR/AcrR family transcriptional regulator [Bacillota bacterium]MBV1727086.1 TetR/AcrR family transcriptional regulator [Desulforudis sp.]MDQ7790454.1 TetR/AcrR family transcriptional regulator [Clostridia bacterium]MDZ4043842.1 TetR/AcrR family transcriptional regulator [Eubacteriales bacterium]MBU4533352.1 TetR/AcrR family transcriptional regulator [Bacillota bacterium]
MNREIATRVLTSFRELSMDKGLKAVTMDELAAHAGVSKRTLYRYFPSKQALVEALVDDLLTGFGREIETMLEGPLSPIEKIRFIISIIAERVLVLRPVIIADIQRYYPTAWDRIDRFRMQRIHYMGELIAEGQKRGEFRPIDPRIVVNAIVAAVRATATPDFVISHGLTMSATIDQLFSLILYGIASDRSSGPAEPD